MIALSRRRALMKGAMLSQVMAPVCWGHLAQASQIPFLDNEVLLRLAEKIIGALPPSVLEPTLVALHQGLHDMTNGFKADIDVALRLLHTDDISHARIHVVHGVAFSHTQLGLLASLLKRAAKT